MDNQNKTHDDTEDAKTARFSSSLRINKKSLIILVLTAIFLISLLLSLSVGRYPIPLGVLSDLIMNKLIGRQELDMGAVSVVLFHVRIPRILAGLMAGAALAVAGAAYQGLFKNPMVSPDILGASAGAGFGAAIAILLSFGAAGIQAASFIFSLAAVGTTIAIGSAISRRNNAILVLVLTGLVVSAMFSSFISITKYAADTDNKLPAITFWLMGGLSSVSSRDVKIMLIPMILGMLPLFLLRWRLNALSFGEEEAQAMGVDVRKLRLAVIACSTLLTASAVSVAGMIGWVGLIIPHAARLLVGSNYKYLLPASLLIGGSFLLLVDDIARSAFAAEIPLGILTSLLGAPFFLYLMLKGRRSWI